MFEVNWGTTIRLNQNYLLCLDVIMPAQNGALIQLWGCNGHTNQQFIYDDSSGVLMYGGDPSLNLCVDAHDLTKSQRLMLWECGGYDVQQWGYDASMQTIYLRLSSAGLSRGMHGEAQPDASFCMDVNGGSFDPGTAINTWECNSCWNQQFILGGGVTHQSAWSRTLVNGHAEEPSWRPLDCPPVPSPKPTGCVGGWPEFSSASALAASPWGAYVTDVYGEVPQGASYPWCVYACSMLVFPSVPVRVHDQPYGRTHLSVGLLADVFGASQHIHPPACRSTPTPRVLYLFPGPLPAGAWATSGRSTRTAFRLTASRRPKASALAPLDRMQNPLLNCIRSTTSSSRQTSSGFGTPARSNHFRPILGLR